MKPRAFKYAMIFFDAAFATAGRTATMKLWKANSRVAAKTTSEAAACHKTELRRVPGSPPRANSVDRPRFEFATVVLVVTLTGYARTPLKGKSILEIGSAENAEWFRGHAGSWALWLG